MLPIKWSTKASTELTEVYHFYADSHSDETAERIVSEILDVTEDLPNFPRKHTIEPELGFPFRFALARHYKIIYYPTETEILILRVFDTRQDPSKLKG